MKKIFYYLMCAVVAMGAMACQNDVDTDITPNENGSEKVSFVAEIGDMTRVSIGGAKDDDKGYPITLDADDVLTVQLHNGGELGGNTYVFKTTDGVNFSCEADDVSELLTGEVYAYLGDIDSFCSFCGIDGINLSGIGNLSGETPKITLGINSAVLTFESSMDVTFHSTAGIFSDICGNDGFESGEQITITAEDGVRYMAIAGGVSTTFSYSIDDVECKSIDITFQPGKLYNLGTLGMATTTVNLVPDWWTSDSADIYAYYWFDGGDGNVLMTAQADGTYKGEIPQNADGMKFVRLNPAYDSFGWNDSTITDRVWNETGDLTLPEGDKNYYYIQYSCWEVKDFVPVAATTKIYFYPDAEWAQAGAWFAAKFGDEWIKLETDAAITDYTIYSCEYTGSAQTVDFYRMDPGKPEMKEENKWDKKTGIAIPKDDKNCFFSTGWVESGSNAGYWATLPVVKTTNITVTAYNYSGWSNSSIYLYAFATPNAAVAWPGVKMTNVSGKKMTATIEVKYFEGDQVAFIVNNNSGKQTANGVYDIAPEITFYFTESIILNEAPSIPNTHLYLKPNSNWKVDNARFAAYFFGNGEKWVSMTDSDSDGIYEVAIPTDKKYPNVIFCRMNPSAAANKWDNKWNQTADLVVPEYGPNVYVVKDGTWDKGGGEWITLE